MVQQNGDSEVSASEEILEQQENPDAEASDSAEELQGADNDPVEVVCDEDDQQETTKKLANAYEEMKQRYYRALADYQNAIRRAAKEQLEARERGVEDFLRKLLPVIDTLEKAMEQIGKSNIDKKIIDGLEMFSIQFSDMLEKEGLKEINARGQKFDPNFHEAMAKQCIEDQDDEIVLTEYEKGYLYKKRVLRPAKVVINQK